jgi:hypothetical protein
MQLKRNLLCILGIVIAPMLFVFTYYANEEPARAANVTHTVQVGCDIHTTDEVDYFFPNNTHKHHRLGGQPALATSTVADLQANTNTSCNTPEYAAEDWFPKIWHGPNAGSVSIRKVNVYYSGDEGETRAPIPDGAQLLGNEVVTDVDYRCGGKGNPVIEDVQDLYGCTKDQFRIRVQMPDCWDGNGLTTEHFAGRVNGDCPAAFPESLIEARLAIHYNTPAGGVQEPIVVSTNGGRAPIDTMHADIFFTVRNSYYRLLEDCGITAPIPREMPAKCRTGEAA